MYYYLLLLSRFYFKKRLFGRIKLSFAGSLRYETILWFMYEALKKDIYESLNIQNA